MHRAYISRSQLMAIHIRLELTKHERWMIGMMKASHEHSRNDEFPAPGGTALLHNLHLCFAA
uniref:Uncharacterized protein n=1 Tax=Meloidogyne incognita TaxID=6306 RepID=A0A914L4T1_MELIC